MQQLSTAQRIFPKVQGVFGDARWGRGSVDSLRKGVDALTMQNWNGCARDSWNVPLQQASIFQIRASERQKV